MCFNFRFEKYINANCASFIVCTAVSFIGLLVSILGISGVLDNGGNVCFYQSLLIMLISFWVSVPRLKPNDKQSNQPKIGDES